MTSLATFLDRLDNDAAAVDYFDSILPGWEDRERFGDTLLSETDFAPDAHEADLVSNEDWDAFIEMTWTDPAER